ncbi:MAG: DUF4111 domain-containing protein [Bacteroidota bacterium]|nr:DUF4111 domain-containing protein [Bacteroidota bacterium]
MTIPSPADEILKELIAGITKVKADFIKGLYLTGSIPLQDYHHGKSDIDFLLLCNELPDQEFRKQLSDIHRKVEQNFKHSNLSGTYLTPGSLGISNCYSTQTLSYHEKRLHPSYFDMAPIILYELKTIGITLLGIPAQHLPIVVHINQVNRFLFENINSYWKRWIDKHSTLYKKKLLLMLMPRLTEWVILGVARQLYTLRTGAIASKTSAGQYCLEHLPQKHHLIVQQAIKIRGDNHRNMLHLKSSYYVQPSIRRIIKTLDCAHFIIDQFNSEYNRMTQNSR